MVAIATAAPGYVAVFYADDGSFIAGRRMTGAGSCFGGTCPYETRNTPTASYTDSNRFYLSMNAYHNFSPYNGIDGEGLFFALEVNLTTMTIDTAWSYPFNGPSGATPTALPVSGGTNTALFFDGYGTMNPLLYKITDTGASYTANWVSATGILQPKFPPPLQ